MTLLRKIDKRSQDDTGWVLDDVWAYDMASTGIAGDCAIGTGYEGGMHRQVESGLWCVVRWLDWVEPVETINQPEVRSSHVVQERTEITWCSDPHNPGGTEIETDIEYGDGSAFFYDALSDAEQEAQRLACIDWRFAWRDWDGRSRHGIS